HKEFKTLSGPNGHNGRTFINYVHNIIQPGTLAVRLTANIIAGQLLITTHLRTYFLPYKDGSQYGTQRLPSSFFAPNA
ncbi:uncharacterized protein LOC110674256, partial [Aedes aegypti]|uniref:Uncharacterized protein n=1 Tax=Aedes aegypti TaxID=7159 RepID=A0A6I8UA65_AEDAE